MDKTKIVKKLGEFLGEELVEFDSEFCEFIEDRPHITINNTRMRVVSVWILTEWFGNTYLCFHLADDNNGRWEKRNIPMSEINNMDEGEIMDLLHDIYYECDQSMEIGDWEDDFLKSIA